MTVTHETVTDAEEYRRLADHMCAALNPPDDDADEGSILIAALDRAVAYIAEHDCECPDDDEVLDDDGPCMRCFALGRSRDKAVEH